jgi:hypothetical protein
VGDTQLLARRAEAKTDAPVEPMGTGERAGLAPAAAVVELSDQDQQLVRARVQARAQLRDGVAEPLRGWSPGIATSECGVGRCRWE